MIYLPLKELLDLSDSGVWGDEDTENGISVLRSTNFRSNGTLDFTKLSFRAVEERKRSAKSLEVGDILLEKSGGGPQQPVGRVCLYRGHAIPHSFGNFIARLRPKDQILSEFLFYFLWYFHATGKTSHYQKQTTGIRNLETQRFFTIDVPVPPLPEQRRIVDLLSRAEGIVRLRREAEKKAAELIPALFNDMFGDPATNPKGWVTRKLGDFCRIIGGASLPAGEAFTDQNGGVLLMKVSDMNSPGNEVCISSCKQWMPERNRSYSGVTSDTIVFPKRGAAIATNKKRIATRPTLLDPNLMGVLPDGDVVGTAYLYQWFSAFDLAHISSGTTVPQLNKGDLTPLVVPIPPMSSQINFEKKRADVLSIQSQQSTATSKAQATFDALLARCFAPTATVEGGSSN